MTRTRGTWGTIDQLPSGRWRAHYPHNGKRHSAPTTFARKEDAEAWVGAQRRRIESEQTRDSVRWQRRPCFVAGCKKAGGTRRLCNGHHDEMRPSCRRLGVTVERVTVNDGGYVKPRRCRASRTGALWSPASGLFTGRSGRGIVSG
jgi:hypothetical protein